MLYEVITFDCDSGYCCEKEKLPVAELRWPENEAMASAPLLVITSYSIHYTKLYDTSQQILRDLASGFDWKHTGHFPRVTHCDFSQRKSGSFNVGRVLSHDVV